MSHRPHVQLGENPSRYRGVCNCRQVGKWSPLRGDAEDWIYHHMQVVERARSGLRNRTPRLTDQRDYYREMADNPEVPANERELWDQLAKEIDHRLNDHGAPNAGEAGLF